MANDLEVNGPLFELRIAAIMNCWSSRWVIKSKGGLLLVTDVWIHELSPSHLHYHVILRINASPSQNFSDPDNHILSFHPFLIGSGSQLLDYKVTTCKYFMLYALNGQYRANILLIS